MSVHDASSLAAVSVTLVLALVAAVWTVATIRATTLQLREAIAGLNKAVSELREKIADLEREMHLRGGRSQWPREGQG